MNKFVCRLHPDPYGNTRFESDDEGDSDRGPVGLCGRLHWQKTVMSETACDWSRR
jgi:hypothetical protein